MWGAAGPACVGGYDRIHRAHSIGCPTGSVVKPSTQNGAHFYASTPGTSGGFEPAWDTTPGNTTADGTVIWTAIKALTMDGTVTGVTDRHTFTDSSRTEQLWVGGKLTWITGDNAGVSSEIKAASAGGVVIMWAAMPKAIQVVDTYTISAGCQKRRIEDCVPVFDNAKNFRGADTIPGADYLISGG